MTRDKLLHPREVAEWLGVKPATLAHWRSRKSGPEGPRHQPVGSRVYYRETDVQAWLDAQREEAAS